MTIGTMRRRNLLTLGAFATAALLTQTSTANALSGDVSGNEMVVRKYYKSWETKDWGPFDAMLADDFTFTSPNGDDHISKVEFKKRCWDTQIDFIKDFDIELMMAKSDQVLVKYVCHTKNGKAFRNVELHRVEGGKIKAIECYFGGNLTFASAVAKRDN